MKRFLLLALLACGPALANERAEGEANLIALSAQVVKAMEAFVPEVDGVRCVPKSLGEDWADYPFRPMIQSICRWADETGEQLAVFDIFFERERATRLLERMTAQQAAVAHGEPLNKPVQFYVKGDAIAQLTRTGFDFPLTPWLSGSVRLDQRRAGASGCRHGRRGADGPARGSGLQAGSCRSVGPVRQPPPPFGRDAAKRRAENA